MPPLDIWKARETGDRAALQAASTAEIADGLIWLGEKNESLTGIDFDRLMSIRIWLAAARSAAASCPDAEYGVATAMIQVLRDERITRETIMAAAAVIEEIAGKGTGDAGLDAQLASVAPLEIEKARTIERCASEPSFARMRPRAAAQEMEHRPLSRAERKSRSWRGAACG